MHYNRGLMISQPSVHSHASSLRAALPAVLFAALEATVIAAITWSVVHLLGDTAPSPDHIDLTLAVALTAIAFIFLKLTLSWYRVEGTLKLRTDIELSVIAVLGAGIISLATLPLSDLAISHFAAGIGLALPGVLLFHFTQHRFVADAPTAQRGIEFGRR